MAFLSDRRGAIHIGCTADSVVEREKEEGIRGHISPDRWLRGSPRRDAWRSKSGVNILRDGHFLGGRRKQSAPYTTSRAPTALRPSVWNDEAEMWPFAASALPYEKAAAVGAVCVTANTPMHGRSGRLRAVRRSAGVHAGKSTRIGSRRDRAACTTAPISLKTRYAADRRSPWTVDLCRSDCGLRRDSWEIGGRPTIDREAERCAAVCRPSRQK